MERQTLLVSRTKAEERANLLGPTMRLAQRSAGFVLAFGTRLLLLHAYLDSHQIFTRDDLRQRYVAIKKEAVNFGERDSLQGLCVKIDLPKLDS